MSEHWTEHLDPNSGKTYYVNSVSGESSWDKPATKELPVQQRQQRPLPLSALSKQLRKLQTKNAMQSTENERLQRQIKITTELKGISISAVKEALRKACEGEAHQELQREIEALQSQLRTANNSGQQQPPSIQFEQEASARARATLELRVGELEEVEETLRAEIASVYSRLGEQTSNASSFESLAVALRADLAAATSSSQPTAATTDAAAEAQRLRGRVSELEREVSTCKASESKLQIAVEQLHMRQQNTDLKKAQHAARFKIQDERIIDLTQQLSSLYTAFELLQHEHLAENKRMVALQSNLHASDSQLAMQLHKEMKDEEESERSNVSTPPSPLPLPPPPPPPLPPPQQQLQPSSSSSSLSHFATATSPPPSMLNTATTVCSGYLFKRAIEKNGKKKSNLFKQGWKKRWFTLTHTEQVSQLTYYQDNVATRIKGTLGPITHHSHVFPCTDFVKYPYAFSFHLNLNSEASNIVLYVAGSQDDQQMWMAALEHCARNSRGSGGTTGVSKELSREEQEAQDHAMAVRMAQEL